MCQRIDWCLCLMQFSLKVNGSPALPAKGENPGVVVASMAPADKSCDNLGLNCIVCGITASSQKNMQDHLKGKIHMRKTDMLARPNPKENEVRNMVWTLPTLSKYIKQ